MIPAAAAPGNIQKHKTEAQRPHKIARGATYRVSMKAIFGAAARGTGVGTRYADTSGEAAAMESMILKRMGRGRGVRIGIWVCRRRPTVRVGGRRTRSEISIR